MLFEGYLVTRSQAKRFTKSEGSVNNTLDCINVMAKFREIIVKHGSTMEIVQYPKAIPDLENSAFLVITRAGASCCSGSGPRAASAILAGKGVRAVEEGSRIDGSSRYHYLPDDHIADFGQPNYWFKKKARRPIHYAATSYADA